VVVVRNVAVAVAVAVAPPEEVRVDWGSWD